MPEGSPLPADCWYSLPSCRFNSGFSRSWSSHMWHGSQNGSGGYSVRSDLLRAGEEFSSQNVRSILRHIAEQGGNPSGWYADTTSDPDEARAYHLVTEATEWRDFKLRSALQATQMKDELARAGVACPPDSMTRGGECLYCFRVREWNCHTLRPMPASGYKLPSWLRVLR